MKKRIIITGIIVAIVHAVLVFGLFGILFAIGMEAFDNPEKHQPTLIERLAEKTMLTLMQPYWSIWPLVKKKLPPVMEWVLIASNSLLWGFAVALLINILTLTTKSKPKLKS